MTSSMLYAALTFPYQIMAIHIYNSNTVNSSGINSGQFTNPD